jgi:hypothetical protein
MAQAIQPSARKLGLEPHVSHPLERNLHSALEHPELAQAPKLKPERPIGDRCANHRQRSIASASTRQRKMSGPAFTVVR